MKKIKISNNDTMIKTAYGEYITPEDIKAIFAEHGQQVKSLSLDFIGKLRGYTLNEYSAQHADVMVEVLTKYEGPLEDLSLSGCNIPESDMIRILTAIMQNPTLFKQMKVLNLEDNLLSYKALMFICYEFLPICSNITSVKLAGEGVGLIESTRGGYDRPGTRLENKYPTLVADIKSICDSRRASLTPPQQEPRSRYGFS